jgi:methionyl aminopeptidase
LPDIDSTAMLRPKPELLLVGYERDAIRYAGQFNAELMDMVRAHIGPGMTTEEIDSLIYQYTMDSGHKPACLGYNKFPKSSCISVNDVVCHGIPDAYRLREGDIVNVDVTTIVEGWLGDQSETFLIGKTSDEARAVTQCAFDCLYLAIDALRPGCRVAEIGRAITNEAHKRRFGVVRDYVGHGIGRRFHQEPSIPHYPTRQSHIDRLPAGICFTIEPMINVGTKDTVLDRNDGWTVRTRDGKLSAQFEHSVLMTEDGPEILTKTVSGPQRGHRF